jgi:hypothetical protein
MAIQARKGGPQHGPRLGDAEVLQEVAQYHFAVLFQMLLTSGEMAMPLR